MFVISNFIKLHKLSEIPHNKTHSLEGTRSELFLWVLTSRLQHSWFDFDEDQHVSLCLSGSAGPECGSVHVRAAQVDRKLPAADGSWGHQLPDVCLWRTGAGTQRPGQRPAVCGHVSQLAAQRLRHVCITGSRCLYTWHVARYDTTTLVPAASA